MKANLGIIRWMVLVFFIGVTIQRMLVNSNLVSYRVKVHTIIAMVKSFKDM